MIFNPPAIAMGGGPVDWEGGFFERMRDAFHSLAKDMPCGPVAIAGAEAGEASGVVGAAALLLEEGE